MSEGEGGVYSRQVNAQRNWEMEELGREYDCFMCLSVFQKATIWNDMGQLNLVVKGTNR